MRIRMRNNFTMIFAQQRADYFDIYFPTIFGFATRDPLRAEKFAGVIGGVAKFQLLSWKSKPKWKRNRRIGIRWL